MRVPQSYIQKLKVSVHVLQCVAIFVAACLTLTIMTKDGDVGGATTYFFALVSIYSTEHTWQGYLAWSLIQMLGHREQG